MKHLTLLTLVKALLLLWAVFIVIGILMDPLGDHATLQPLTAVVLILAVNQYEKIHGGKK